ncbi:MAG: glutaminase A [Opitutales bacterium]|nr:glutaminase A [Opitutales bacterium]
MRQEETIRQVLQEVYEEAGAVDEGELAGYIPQLASVNPEFFALSVCDTAGNCYAVGDRGQSFTLQSVSKVLAHACVLSHCDEERLGQRVGVEPTGEDFDSIVKLDQHRRAFNPMVNTGAIAIADLLLSIYGEDALPKSRSFFASTMGVDSLDIDQSVFESELATGERNRAIGHLLKNFKLLDHPVKEVLELYFAHCSLCATTDQLARLGASLANGGQLPGGGERVLDPAVVRKVLSVMLSCGMYNDAGRWIYDVGLPAKSGVSGCLLVVVPGELGIAAYSPRIDNRGTSVRGLMAVRLLSERLNLHLFA